MCGSVLQSVNRMLSRSVVAVWLCCSVLECVAVSFECVEVCCRASTGIRASLLLQCGCVAVWLCCSVLECVAVSWSVLQSVHRMLSRSVFAVWLCCSRLQCVVVCCSVLQCVAERPQGC